MRKRPAGLEALGAILGSEYLGGKPEPLQPTNLARVLVVLKRPPSVEHVIVVDELHVTSLKDHLHLVIGISDQLVVGSHPC
mgnify:FL=1